MLHSVIANKEVTRHILKAFRLHASKRLGQNFLIDPGIVSGIVDAAEIQQGDRVLEIGPGIGTLTQGLAEAGAQITAVELDKKLPAVLAETLAGYDNVKIIQGDILKTDIPSLMGAEPFKVAANLPYYITTPILLSLIHSDLPISLFVFMMQKEVADRILADPGTKDYGALTLAVQYYCTAERVLDIPPTAFIPRPQVTSTVLRLRRRSEPAVSVKDSKLLFSLIKMGFAQRRKVFTNAVKFGGIPNEISRKIFEVTGIDGSRRGETFSLEEYAALADAWYDLIHD